MRVVSLLPSATEIVGALGLQHLLVGRSSECDVPADVAALPAVSAGRLDGTDLSGPEIDDVVRAAAAAGESLYVVDGDLLDALRPDVILTQDLCRVCAVARGQVSAPAAEVISLDPHSIDEIAASVRMLGHRLGAPGAGERVADDMLARIARVRARVAGRAPRRVFFAEWHDPPFAAGHWVPEQVAAAGGVDVLATPRLPSRRVAWDDVIAADPELIVVGPCGYDEAAARTEWDRACAAGRVPAALAARGIPVDANAFFSRPAPAVARGVEVLARIFHDVDGPPGG